MASPAMARALLVLLVAVAGAAVSARAAGLAPAPAPAVDCGAVEIGLADCLSYVQAGGQEKRPSKSCCAGVRGAVKDPAAVACLCSAFGQDLGIKINMTRAAGLPAACGASADAFSKCHIALPGAPSEAPSPSALAPATGGPSPHAAATRRQFSASILAATVAVSLLAYYII